MEHREMDQRGETCSYGMTERQHWTKHGEMDRSCTMERQYGPRSDQDSRRRQGEIKVRRHQQQIPPEQQSRRRPLRDPSLIQMRCKSIGEGGQLNAITATGWDIFRGI